VNKTTVVNVNCGELIKRGESSKCRVIPQSIIGNRKKKRGRGGGGGFNGDSAV